MLSRKITEKNKEEGTFTIVDVFVSTKHQFGAPPLGNLPILLIEMVCGNQIKRGNFSFQRELGSLQNRRTHRSVLLFCYPKNSLFFRQKKWEVERINGNVVPRSLLI